MAKKYLVNCMQTLGTTGVALTTSNTVTTTGNSQELYEFATADAVRFYLDITAVSGSGAPTMVLELDERDPATGSFFASGDMGTRGSTANTTMWSTGGFTATTSAPVTFDINPCLAEAYQVKWTISGTAPSFTGSLLALLTYRD
jgi:hypothetical protein